VQERKDILQKIKDQITVVNSEIDNLDSKIHTLHSEITSERKIFLKYRREEIQDLITGLQIFNLQTDSLEIAL
jgi:hypothetical protein